MTGVVNNKVKNLQLVQIFHPCKFFVVTPKGIRWNQLSSQLVLVDEKLVELGIDEIMSNHRM